MRAFDTGDLKSHIIHLSWPMVVANVFQNLALAFELFLIGRLGLEALAAISIVVSSIYAVFLSIHGGLINGAIAMVSRYSGNKEYDKVNTAVVQMTLFAVAAFVVYGILLFIFLDPILNFFGAKGAVFTMAKDFTLIMLLSFMPMAFFTIGIGVFRGAGDSITPLKSVLLMAAINVICNPLFMFTFNMGLKGAALSAVIMDTAAMIMFIALFIKGKNNFKLNRSNFRIDTELLSKYSALSLKGISQGLIGDAGSIAMLKIVSGFGNEMIAAYGIVGRLVFYLLMFGWPIGNSGAAVVGHNLGKKLYDRVRQAVMESIKVFSWISVPAAILFFIFADQIIGFFTQDPVVRKYGAYYLRVMAPVLPVFGAGVNIQSGFNGAGAAGVPAVVSFVSLIVFRLALALTLPLLPAIAEYGIFWAVAASWLVFTMIFWILFKRGKWMLKEI